MLLVVRDVAPGHESRSMVCVILLGVCFQKLSTTSSESIHPSSAASEDFVLQGVCIRLQCNLMHTPRRTTSGNMNYFAKQSNA